MHVRNYQLMQYFHTLTITVPACTITSISNSAHFAITEGTRNIHFMIVYWFALHAIGPIAL